MDVRSGGEMAAEKIQAVKGRGERHIVFGG